MTPASDWTEDRAEAERWAQALRRTVKYATARITITRHDGPNGRTYYRVETDR
jgi:hypothetical protein